MKRLFFVFILIIILFAFINPSLAQQGGNLSTGAEHQTGSFLQWAGRAANFDVTYDENLKPGYQIVLIIVTIIRVILTLTGVFFLGLLVYGGYSWMTAGGNEEALQKAKQTLVNAVIGMAIVIFGLAITLTVNRILVRSTTEGGSFIGGGLDKSGAEFIIE